ncbi:TPA: hypothetical protein SMO30_004829 [Pseudomonas aeruginosa]|uniref:hypothetical protein n=2 Tax=Pseudomonas aeruginosa TaxID=287 RepID=UPI001367DB44|nr:hypothetical protein [Pseudomonas aeruginosa]MWW48791.1 hypothetical protein [Pseudomonas aeruginosa]HEK0054286.1 hypothetical protein [Pseudomonas aeruginosa]
MLQMERSGKPRPAADRYRHGPGVRKSSIGKEVDLHREYHHAIFLAIASALESSKIKAFRRHDSPEFASIGTKTGTGSALCLVSRYAIPCPPLIQRQQFLLGDRHVALQA